MTRAPTSTVYKAQLILRELGHDSAHLFEAPVIILRRDTFSNHFKKTRSLPSCAQPLWGNQLSRACGKALVNIVFDAICNGHSPFRLVSQLRERKLMEKRNERPTAMRAGKVKYHVVEYLPTPVVQISSFSRRFCTQTYGVALQVPILGL